jgi:hypothetical protein
VKVGAIRFVPVEEAPQADRFPPTGRAARFDARRAARLQHAGPSPAPNGGRARALG